jgi:hypothetical protein
MRRLCWWRSRAAARRGRRPRSRSSRHSTTTPRACWAWGWLNGPHQSLHQSAHGPATAAAQPPTPTPPPNIPHQTHPQAAAAARAAALDVCWPQPAAHAAGQPHRRVPHDAGAHPRAGARGRSVGGGCALVFVAGTVVGASGPGGGAGQDRQVHSSPMRRHRPLCVCVCVSGTAAAAASPLQGIACEHVRHAIQLEQWLMEGAYNKVGVSVCAVSRVTLAGAVACKRLLPAPAHSAASGLVPPLNTSRGMSSL